MILGEYGHKKPCHSDKLAEILLFRLKNSQNPRNWQQSALCIKTPLLDWFRQNPTKFKISKTKKIIYHTFPKMFITKFSLIFLISKAFSHNPICRQESHHMSTSQFVDNVICKNKKYVREMTRKVCKGDSKCFQCNSESLKIENARLVKMQNCKKNVPAFLDHHLTYSACNQLTNSNNWNLCLDPESFISGYCPMLKKYGLKKSESLCCREKIYQGASFGCMSKPNLSHLKTYKILITQKTGKQTKYHFSHAEKSSCCATLS